MPLTRLRVLFVGTFTEPGGAASHLVSLATALVRAGHCVSVVATPGGGVWDALSENTGVALYAATFTRAFDEGALRALNDAVGAAAPDCIVAVFEQDYWGSALVAARRRIPCALFLHHAGMKRVNRLMLPFVRRRFLVPSRDLRQWVLSLGVAGYNADVLYNPIDTSHFHPDAALRERTRRELGFGPDDCVVAFAGRIETNKGVVPFAKALTLAMSRVPSLRALWVGFGRRDADVDAIIRASPFADRHVRRGWADDMRPYYAAMDMLALPSTGRESFGRVLAEAQSCGVAVCGSSIGGIPEAMQPGRTGVLVSPGDVSAWADALCALAEDPDRRRSMGVSGREFVRATFDPCIIARDFERWARTTFREVAEPAMMRA